ncbi:MAG: acetolactate synthase large subunit [Alphaproteobacteria bacterium]|nr:acetolactate synthase large subunit [Alphaproteobacteria bacterium]
MFGAQALVTTLADCGVRACFANPGTSEMHLVAALDREPRIRSVLALFEGVATGAADGYARIAGRPAMTLLHLGSGLANGGANLHNARKGRSPIVNVVGDHATYHLHLDAPLTSDILGLARPLSVWAKSAPTPAHCGTLAAEAYAAAVSGRGPATLILPADSAWTAPAFPAAPLASTPAHAPSAAAIEAAARRIKGAAKPVVLIAGTALQGEGLAAAARVEAAGVRVLMDTFPAIQARGAGRFAPSRMQYFGEMALADLAGVDLMALVGTRAPAAFFAYPGKPSILAPEGCEIISAADESTDAGAALALLADALGAPKTGPVSPLSRPGAPSGDLSVADIAASIARHLPENAIVADDGVTSSLPIYALTQSAAPHDWMFLTGGAIGAGMPLAVGAAVAAPDRKVVALTGDGAGMYTNQALWTMAREGLDVLTIVFANRSYRILNIEFQRTGAGNMGPTAHQMLSLDGPAVDWAALARAQGVEAVRVTRAEEFDAAFERLIGAPGPKLIEAVI